MFDGRIVLYCIGEDMTDNHGEEWDRHPTSTGDMTFSLRQWGQGG